MPTNARLRSYNSKYHRCMSFQTSHDGSDAKLINLRGYIVFQRLDAEFGAKCAHEEYFIFICALSIYHIKILKNYLRNKPIFFTTLDKPEM
jgi:hypothetical protein